MTFSEVNNLFVASRQKKKKQGPAPQKSKKKQGTSTPKKKNKHKHIIVNFGERGVDRNWPFFIEEEVVQFLWVPWSISDDRMDWVTVLPREHSTRNAKKSILADRIPTTSPRNGNTPTDLSYTIGRQPFAGEHTGAPEDTLIRGAQSNATENTRAPEDALVRGGQPLAEIRPTQRYVVNKSTSIWPHEHVL